MKKCWTACFKKYRCPKNSWSSKLYRL